MRVATSSLLLTCLVGVSLAGINDVMYQSFDWAVLSQPRSTFYQNTQNSLPNLAGAGIAGVWFPPPSETADVQGYLPGEWYSIRAAPQLASATNATRERGMKVIMDIVINHRSGQSVDSCTKQYTVFKNPDWGNNKVVKHDSVCDNSEYTVPDNCGPGNYDTGENCCYCPDVDHTNGEVQNDIINWLSWLESNYSVNGYRYDMVVGYNGKYVEQYNGATNPTFSVGEYWDGNTNNVVNWLKQCNFKSNAFDFPNRYALDTAIKKNNYGGLMSGIHPVGVMGLYPANSSPFLDNHDTARDDRFANGNVDKITMGYAYILTHPGVPFVFYDDWNIGSIQSAIKKMIPIRKNNGLTSDTPIYIAKHQQGLYAAFLGPGATGYNKGTVAMKLGTSSWNPDLSQYKLGTSGNNYAIWVRK